MGNKHLIDAHMHLWDTDAHIHPWLVGHALGKPYVLDDYLGESACYRFDKAVHIQAGIDRPDSVLETAWVERISKDAGFPLAIVGYVDLSDAQCEQQIVEHLAYPGFVGVRQILCDDMDYLSMRVWHEHVSLLGKYNLVFDAQIRMEQADALCKVLSHHSSPFVLEHLGLPKQFNSEYFEHWHVQLKKLAQFEHVSLKLSGFAMTDPQWTVEQVKPFVAAAIDCFGVSRCMFGSNFPVDKPFKRLDELYDGFYALCSLLMLSDDEQDALFYRNADRVYF